jgi:MFS family permease
MSAPVATPAPDPPAGVAYSPAYLRYALGLLTVVYVVNFVDRQILSILLQSIKRDLGLSDLQLGLLSGTAFGLFYATLGVPIARLADVFSRKWVISVCLTIWSGMTALCGTAAGFGILLAYRVGVGIGEAGGSPPAHSLISDYFRPERRATALGVFSLGVPIGILIGFLAGGWLDQTLGWRQAFVVVGLPGLVLAVLVALTLKEPRRGHSEGLESTGEVPGAGDVIRHLWGLRTFRHVSLGAALYAFVGYSVVTWAPAFLIRSHGMETGAIGTWLSLIFGLGGGVGVLAGGALADRWAVSDPRGRVWIPALAMLAGFPFAFVIYLTDDTTLALVTLIGPSVFGLMYQAPAFAVTQSLATVKMRATAAAVLLFVINIVGLALGPAVTGALSDALEPRFGDESLRYAMLTVSMALPWSAFHFWRAARTLEADVAQVQRASRSDGVVLGSAD